MPAGPLFCWIARSNTCRGRSRGVQWSPLELEGWGEPQSCYYPAPAGGCGYGRVPDTVGNSGGNVQVSPSSACFLSAPFWQVFSAGQEQELEGGICMPPSLSLAEPDSPQSCSWLVGIHLHTDTLLLFPTCR